MAARVIEKRPAAGAEWLSRQGVEGEGEAGEELEVAEDARNAACNEAADEASIASLLLCEALKELANSDEQRGKSDGAEGLGEGEPERCAHRGTGDLCTVTFTALLSCKRLVLIVPDAGCERDDVETHKEPQLNRPVEEDSDDAVHDLVAQGDVDLAAAIGRRRHRAAEQDDVGGEAEPEHGHLCNKEGGRGGEYARVFFHNVD
mmetsp:Transcript_4180/g.9132  ORF Transcript_4180/g.9132 Transcript_4180/m.9132 type:complete len:204 (-) Transcript_4180:608-1219(-)